MFVQLLSHLVTYYLIPATFLWFLGWGRFKARLDWLVTAIMVSTYIIYIYFSGRWDWIWYPFRMVVFWSWLGVVLYSGWKTRRLPSRKSLSPQRKFLYGFQGIITSFFALFAYFAVKGQFYNGEMVTFQFPLQQGTYYIAQGGNSAILNYHHLAKPAQYALDITRLGSDMRRAQNWMPAQLEQFYIYGDSVFAPCDGVIFAVTNSVPDMMVGEVDTAHFVGNYVGIRHPQGYHVFLAHLQKGSIPVTPGDTVTTGQFLGLVGHSGVVDEPMLHLHVERSDSLKILTGVGVAITFNDRRFLTRNDLIRKTQ